jgi:hypothetical protein
MFELNRSINPEAIWIQRYKRQVFAGYILCFIAGLLIAGSIGFNIHKRDIQIMTDNYLAMPMIYRDDLPLSGSTIQEEITASTVTEDLGGEATDNIWTCHVTHYGPPTFTLGDPVARDGKSVGHWLELAKAGGLTGICAVSPGTKWYSEIRNPMPPILWVEGKGFYLAVDKTASRIWNTVDIYEPDQQGNMYSDDFTIREWIYEKEWEHE